MSQPADFEGSGDAYDPTSSIAALDSALVSLVMSLHPETRSRLLAFLHFADDPSAVSAWMRVAADGTVEFKMSAAQGASTEQ